MSPALDIQGLSSPASSSIRPSRVKEEGQNEPAGGRCCIIKSLDLRAISRIRSSLRKLLYIKEYVHNPRPSYHVRLFPDSNSPEEISTAHINPPYSWSTT